MRREQKLIVHVLAEIAREGMALGRHVEHDARSLAYVVEAWESARLATKLWRRRAPILDQGAVGSCTGNAMAGVIGTDWARGEGWTAASEGLAVELYTFATRLDRIPGHYPEQDTGSTGLAVCKAADRMSYISGYRHALSLHGALTALQAGPVITGIPWFDSFDAPGTGGLVTISADAVVRGGHEVEVLGVDTEARTVRCANSWGEAWGDGGFFTLPWKVWDELLHDDGDVTIPVRL